MCDGVVYIAPKIYTVKDLTTVRDIQLDPKLAQATFLVSAPSLDYCPPECGPEIGFCGRSNAGKSSTLKYINGPEKPSSSIQNTRPYSTYQFF